MNLYHLCSSLLILLLSVHSATAQIHIDTVENVTMGSTSNANSQLRVVAENDNYGIYNYYNYDHPGDVFGHLNLVTSLGLNNKYGMFNEVRTNSLSTGTTTGFYNKLLPASDQEVYGIQNRLNNAGTGKKTGYYGVFYQNAASDQSLTSHYGICRNYGTGPTLGLYTRILADGAGKKEGVYTSVNQNAASNDYARGSIAYVYNEGTGGSIGVGAYVYAVGTNYKYGFRGRTYENANSVASTYGIYNQTYNFGQSTGGGIWNRVYDNATSSGTKYGIHSFVEDRNSNTTDKYGIYTAVENQGTGTNYALYAEVIGGGDYAGYFDGNVTITGTLIDGVSDARLKERNRALDNALGIIRQLRPQEYFYKQDQGIQLPRVKQFGLVAQELERILPNLVTEFTHPGKPIYRTILEVDAPALELSTDEPGVVDVQSAKLPASSPSKLELIPGEPAKPRASRQEIVAYEDAATYKAINYKALIPILIKGMQEQQAQIEKLRAEVRELRRDR